MDYSESSPEAPAAIIARTHGHRKYAAEFAADVFLRCPHPTPVFP
jgi:hypothetical protein